MNCLVFERNAADWLGGRLPAALSWRMAAHRDRCAACARLAERETRLRGLWQGTTPPSPDIWPVLAQRLATGERPRVARLPVAPVRRWAWGGMALLSAGLCATVVAFSLHGVTPGMPPNEPVTVRQYGGALPAGTSGAAVTPPMLTVVSQEDSGVDDPLGTSMDNVWTHLQINAATSARGR